MKLIDVHAHLDMLENPTEEVLDFALSQGVETIFTVGTEPQDWPTVLALAEKFHPRIYCTLGLHPHQARLWSPKEEAYLRRECTKPYVVALGEIGLDYYYHHSSEDQQRKAFEEQLSLACELGLPVQIHTRDAEDDTLAILKNFQNRAGGLIHCFTGSDRLAQACLDLGYSLSVSGVVTFKNAHSLRETIKKVPLDRLTVETDSPFLTPVPHRGKKNTPAFVADVARFVADLKEVDYEDFVCQTRKNTEKLFPKIFFNI
jgi:TatD DNase family protein